MATISHNHAQTGVHRLVPPVTEVQRLRTETAQLRSMLAAAADAIAAAVDAGYAQALDHLADAVGGRAVPVHPNPAHLRRYHLACPPCRGAWLESGGKLPCGRPGCEGCAQRSRADFGQPMAGDYPGTRP